MKVAEILVRKDKMTMCRLNKAKWCRIHKRPLFHENDAKWWTVTCPGHFKVMFPLVESARTVYSWALERYGVNAEGRVCTHVIYGR